MTYSIFTNILSPANSIRFKLLNEIVWGNKVCIVNTVYIFPSILSPQTIKVQMKEAKTISFAAIFNICLLLCVCVCVCVCMCVCVCECVGEGRGSAGNKGKRVCVNCLCNPPTR